MIYQYIEYMSYLRLTQTFMWLWYVSNGLFCSTLSIHKSFFWCQFWRLKYQRMLFGTANKCSSRQLHLRFLFFMASEIDFITFCTISPKGCVLRDEEGSRHGIHNQPPSPRGTGVNHTHHKQPGPGEIDDVVVSIRLLNRGVVITWSVFSQILTKDSP